MAYPVDGTARRRIDILAETVAAVLPNFPGCRVLGFSSGIVWIDRGVRVPEPAGGTALHLALEVLLPLRPERIVVISDGEPDDSAAALAAARRLGCAISTYYCGDDGNHAAIAFLRALAWCSADGFGRAAVTDLRKPAALEKDIRLALAAPA